VNKNKYLVGLIGLAVGFIISYFLTTNYNKNNPSPAANTEASGGMGSQGGAGGQQAMMGQVQQVIDKAKSNPTDFQSQVEAAKIFNQVGRVPETVEYLKKAYDISSDEFVKRGKGELQGALLFMGMFYNDQKNYDESDKWLRRALDASPEDQEARTEVASSYLRREPPQADRAIQELQKALKANPKDGHALGHIIEAYVLKKDAAAAEDALNKLKDADPTNQRLTALSSLISDVKAGKIVTLPKE
jgi:tetratricopeptide (TPR) repeat protein